VRERFLSPTLRLCVMGLLSVWPMTSGCRRAEAPVEGRDLADLDRLLRLMERRLALMHDVARWKWNARAPISDPGRERDSLQVVVGHGLGKGLDPDLVRPFFAAQMAAARLVQRADFDRWEAETHGPFADATGLSELRQQVDHLNDEMIDALAEVRPRLSIPIVQRALPRRAEEILTGEGQAGVRETAIAPLRR
jgi:chorismate mutase-like protein